MNNENNSRTDGRRVRKARNVPSDRQFTQAEALKRSGINARGYVQVILLIAALTTFSTGAISVWGNSVWDGLTMFWKLMLTLQGVAVGSVMVALADGSRWGWGNARTADESTGAMQWIAMVMEGVNFSISAYISAIGLAPLLVFLGLPAVYDAAWVQSSVLLMLQASFLVNIVAGFLWMVLSPKSVQLTSMAMLENQKQGMYLLKVKKYQTEALKNEGGEIESVMQDMIDDRMLDGFNRFLEMNGFETAGDSRRLPPPPVAQPVSRPKRERPVANSGYIRPTLEELVGVDGPAQTVGVPPVNGVGRNGSGPSNDA